MMKSIGGKIYAVLGILCAVFVVMLFVNYTALEEIEENNATVSVYMQMQEVKSEVSTSFQQVQLYSNLTYFKKDKPDEKDLMIEKLGNSMVAMDTQLDELGSLIATLNDQEITDAYNTWRTETDTFKVFIDSIHADALKGDYEAVFERVNVQNVNKAPVQEAEDAYDEVIKTKEAAMVAWTAERITAADATNVACMVLFVITIIGAASVVTITMVKPTRVSGKVLETIVAKLKNDEGDLTERIPVKTKDEIGQMTRGGTAL